MLMKRKLFTALIITFVAFNYFGCKKTEIKNPYDEIDRTVQNDNPDADDIPVGNFAWLHAKIFKPTCANSGCHDGTFEPEFRTIASAYNSLVNQPVIANDPAESFTYRVVPGNHGASWLHERMTVDVENTSGMMPAVIDEGSDYPEMRDFYISKIEEWIDGGAQDMYGSSAPSAGANAEPLVYGMVVFPSANTTDPFPREENLELGFGPILVSGNTVDFWFTAYDDNAGLNNFSSFKMKLSQSLSDFSLSPEIPCLLSGPVAALDFTNNPTAYYYKASVDISSIPSGETRYVRVYVNDGIQTMDTETPNSASNYFWYLLFSIKKS